MGKQWRQGLTIFLGSKITADGDCSYEIKRCLLLGRKVMTHLDSILKSRDMTLSTEVLLVKAMVFFQWLCMDVRVGLWRTPKNWCFWTVVLEKTLESPLDCKEIQPVHPKGAQSWVFIGRTDVETETPILWPPDAVLPHLKRPWWWERLREGGEGDDGGWDGWTASPTQWTWVWVDSGSWWWTGRPGILRFMGSQRVGHNWATELNWTKRKKMMHISMFILTPFMTLMHRRYFIFPMERAPYDLHAAHGANRVLTSQLCPETWRFPCLWRTEYDFHFFPVQLTVLSGKIKTKQFLDNDLKYSKTLHIFIFLSICLR